MLIIAILLGAILGCSSANDGPKTAELPRFLDRYSFKGLRFSYYLIEKDLDREQLIAVARKIHEEEPDTQLILVDDESGVDDYIKYAKAVSLGKTDVELPKAWADKHIVANLQKFLSGKWMLYKGYGYEEIAAIQ